MKCKHNVIAERTEGRMTLQVVPDDYPESPREWDNLGTILYTSNRYILGDKQMYSEEIQAIEEDPKNICFPVYAYIHGGVSLSMGAFSCRWDSGQCGIIYCTEEKARDWFQSTEDWDTLRKRVEENFKHEIKIYTDFLESNVYGLIYLVDGQEIDSVFGNYGSPSKLLEDEWHFEEEYYQPLNDYQI